MNYLIDFYFRKRMNNTGLIVLYLSAIIAVHVLFIYLLHKFTPLKFQSCSAISLLTILVLMLIINSWTRARQAKRDQVQFEVSTSKMDFNE